MVSSSLRRCDHAGAGSRTRRVVLVLPVVGSLALAGASGLLFSGCSKRGAASDARTPVVYVDVCRVAQAHPAWRGSVTCGLVREGLRTRSVWRFSSGRRPTPATPQPVPVSALGRDLAETVRSATERDVEAFETSQRAAAESRLKSFETELAHRSEAERAAARRASDDDLRNALRTISEDYAAKALPLRLKLQTLSSNQDSYGDLTIRRSEPTAKLSTIAQKLAALTADRDTRRTGALSAWESRTSEVNQQAARMSDEQIAAVRAEAEEVIRAEVADRRGAALPPLVELARSRPRAFGAQGADHRSRTVQPIDPHGPLVASAVDLSGRGRELRRIALRDARAFAIALARTEGLHVVLDPSKRRGIPDSTDEFVRRFAERLSPSVRGRSGSEPI